MTSTTWIPAGELEIVAGTPPGGGLDRAARALAKAIEANRLSDRPVRVNNVPGDGARKCWTYLDGRASDPHVVSVSSVNLTTDHLLGAAPFYHERAFTPLAILYTEYIAFVVRSDSPLKQGKDLLARFARDAASVTVALSTSLGNPNHIALAEVVRHAGGDARAPKLRVFDSALDAVADAMAGNADVAAVTAASAVKELEGKNMRALAVSAPERLERIFANAPTWREQSVDCMIGSWRGITGARGITADQIAFWTKLLEAAIATKEWKHELAHYYWTPMPLFGGALWDHLERERAEMRAILEELGLLKARDEK
ncbi:MAG TPA: tripartite tricarboxylate transporter substrate-binding protein [Burkholderiales bacterium]|jgi:putative tricarboxylic transport membrane protein|nr:tripartite tricarboxylate transporter substrate-binding protein [Burkholderiales bacterium]